MKRRKTLRTKDRMKKMIWKVGLAIAAAVVCFAPNALADGGTVTMTLTSAGTNAYDNAVYIGPYYAQIGGSSTTTPVICDDYVDDSYVPESWNATETNEASVSTATTPLKYGDNQTLYNELAYLATQLMANQGNTATIDAIQFAIWDLGYEDLNGGAGITNLPLPTGTTNWINAAEANSGTTYGNVDIYSFSSCNSQVSSPCSNSNPPQEFMVVTTPEPSTILMLVLGLGGLFFVWRRQRNTGAMLAV
jgi:hypothetical protein